MAIIVIAGVFGLVKIGQKEDPDFTFRVMIVQALWPGASLQDMQDQVVNKIERKLQETPHLDYVKSFTRAGSAVITVNIKGDTSAAEVADAFYQVRKKTGDIANELPAGLLGPYFNDEYGDTFITLHAIYGDGYSFPELKTFAKAARDQLLRRSRRRESLDPRRPGSEDPHRRLFQVARPNTACPRSTFSRRSTARTTSIPPAMSRPRRARCACRSTATCVPPPTWPTFRSRPART